MPSLRQPVQWPSGLEARKTLLRWCQPLFNHIFRHCSFLSVVFWQVITIYYGGELAKEISERIFEHGGQRGFKMALSDMEIVKKQDFTTPQTGIFVIQVN